MGRKVQGAHIWVRKPGTWMFQECYRWQGVILMAPGPCHTYLASKPSCVQHALDHGIIPRASLLRRAS